MKKFLKLVFVSIIVVSLFSCNKSADTRENISGSVMLYSSMDEDTLRLLKKAFETKYPGVTLDYYFSTLERVNNRLAAENSTKLLNCDVIWAGSQLDFEAYKENKYLEPYKSKEANKIHKIFKDKENYYTGARVAAIGFGYLSDKQIKVKEYEDLLNENLKGQIAIINPEKASISKLFIASMMQHKNYGENFFRQLFENGAEMYDSSDAAKNRVQNGEKAVCFAIDYLNTGVKEEGDTFTFSYPKKDVVFFYTPIGIARDSVNIENAKLLVDFILSKEGQNIIASSGNLSTRKDLKSVINTQKYFSKAMKVDVKDLYKNIDSYMEKFNSLR